MKNMNDRDATGTSDKTDKNVRDDVQNARNDFRQNFSEIENKAKNNLRDDVGNLSRKINRNITINKNNNNKK